MHKSQPFNHFLQHTDSRGITAKLANVVINERNLTRINREKYVSAVDAIVLNLFTAYFESSKKVVGISRDKNYWDGKDKFYKNSKLTFTTVVTSLDILEKHKYIKLVEEGKQGLVISQALLHVTKLIESLSSFTRIGIGISMMYLPTRMHPVFGFEVKNLNGLSSIHS